MGELSDDLERMGYERTDKESPFEEDGRLWTNGAEMVCDETGIVVGSGHSTSDEEREYHRYPNSERVRMVGGYFSAYDWGYDDGHFTY